MQSLHVHVACFILVISRLCCSCICVTCTCIYRRNLEYYDMCHNEKVRLCDSDCTANSGELTIKIPKDTYSTPGMGEALVHVIMK